MKLKNAIKNIPDDTLIYVSAGTSFIFIGTKETFNNDFQRINDELIRIGKDSLRRYHYDRVKIQSVGLMIDVNVFYKPHRGKWLDATGFTKNRLDTCDKMIPHYKNYLETFKPIENREVTSTRLRRWVEPGVIIEIEGDEIGRFWFKHEYDEKYHDVGIDGMIAERMAE